MPQPLSLLAQIMFLFEVVVRTPTDYVYVCGNKPTLTGGKNNVQRVQQVAQHNDLNWQCVEARKSMALA